MALLRRKTALSPVSLLHIDTIKLMFYSVSVSFSVSGMKPASACF